MIRKLSSLLVKLVVTIAILVFLFMQVPFSRSDFFSIMSRVDFRYLMPAMTGVVVVLGIKSFRWKLLVNREGYPYNSGKAFGAYMSSDAIGIVTPGRIGEIARLYYLRQENDISFENAFKTVVVDRIFDLTFLGWFGFSGLLFYFKTFGEYCGVYYLLSVLLFIIAGFLVLRMLFSFLSGNPKTSRFRLFPFLNDCLKAATGFRAWNLWIITFFAYLAYFFFSALIMYALGVTPHFVEIAFIMSLMSSATILPVSVAGFGTREASLVLLFTQYGITSETAISFSLLHFTAFFLLGGLIGLVFWLYMPISLKTVKQDTRKVAELFYKTTSE